MADLLFSPSTQPILNCILENFNARRIDSIYKQLISGGVILNDELVTNANPLIVYLNLITNFYNLEGANRILSYRDATPNVVYAMPSLGTTLSTAYGGFVIFSTIAFSGAMVNAGTTLTFNGYRINL